MYEYQNNAAPNSYLRGSQYIPAAIEVIKTLDGNSPLFQLV